jgi:hypothetical protein
MKKQWNFKQQSCQNDILMNIKLTGINGYDFPTEIR